MLALILFTIICHFRNLLRDIIIFFLTILCENRILDKMNMCVCVRELNRSIVCKSKAIFNNSVTRLNRKQKSKDKNIFIFFLVIEYIDI